jgi:phage/plasmid-like protein (TIGR03299 family)
MAHEVEWMASQRGVEWHGLAQVVPTLDTQWLRDNAPLFMSEVESKELKLSDGRTVAMQAHVRKLDGRVQGYSTGQRYEHLQPTQALDHVDELVKLSEGRLRITTAINLKQGEKQLVQLEMNQVEVVPGDPIRNYIAVVWGNDGVTGINTMPSSERIVCANTLAICERHKNTQMIRITHSKRNADNLALIRDALNMQKLSFEATAEQFKLLARRSINRGDIEKYVKLVFYNNAQAETDRERMFRDRMNADINRLFESGRGSDMSAGRGTWWRAYNAVTEYLSHEAGREMDARLESLWFGRGKAINARALEGALELAYGKVA